MRQRGLSLAEIIIAVVVMVLALFPLIGIFTEGMRATRVTIQEVQAAGLAAELVEQVDAMPFEVLETALASGQRDWSSETNTLVDAAAVTATDAIAFHLSPMPPGFSRKLDLRMVGPGLVLAEGEVVYVLGKRRRSLLLRRYVAKDSSAEVEW